MKFAGKFLVAVCLLATLGVGAYLVRTNVKASTSSTNYVFTNSGIMFGAESSPLQITQVTSGGYSLPIGSAVAGDENLLDGVTVTLKNVGQSTITSALLRVDVLDPQTNRIVVTSPGLYLSSALSADQEVSGKVLAFPVAGLHKSATNAGVPFQRIMVQVDLVEMTNGISWRYGLLHRQDSQNSNRWVPISLINPRISLNQSGNGKAKLEKASLRSTKSVDDCLYFGGYEGPNGCPYCTVYDEIWYDNPGHNFGTAGPVPWHCSDPNVADCSKIGYTGYCGP